MTGVLTAVIIFCVHIKMSIPPKWSNNSCYIDSLIYTLHCIAPDILNTIRPDVDQAVAKNLRKAFKDLDIATMRKLFQKVDGHNDWLRAQQEPIEVLFLLERYFKLPRTVYTHKTVYGSNNEKGGKMKLIQSKCERHNFASVIIKAPDVDQRMKLSYLDVAEIENWDAGYKYRIEKKTTLVDQFVMVHIDRNNFGTKSKAAIYPIKKLQKSCALKAVLVHLGNNANSGHYVAYILQGKKWFLYDDMGNGLKEIGTTLPDKVFKNSSDYIYA